MSDWNDEARARGRERAERARSAGAQAAYVEQWRAEHPTEAYTDVWVCPLCNKALQTTVQLQRFDLSHDAKVGVHQQYHGSDWTAYQAAGADRATAGQSGEGR